MATIWITGAKGFIGRHLVKRLNSSGHVIFGLGHGAWPAEEASHAGLSAWINGDIDSANLWQLLQWGGPPDAIYHLAGGSSVALSMQSPKEDFHRTISSTAELLEWVRTQSPEAKLVAVSSAAVYGDAAGEALTETGSYTPFSPYGFHKRTVELLCQSYVQNFGLRIAVVRLFSVYGPGLAKQLLFDVCSRLSRNPKDLVMQGTGLETRDWLHVEDAVRLLELVCDSTRLPFRIVNGGSGEGHSVADTVKLLCNAWGCSPAVSFTGLARPGDPKRLVADISAQRNLGFVPQVGLQDGIASYVRWFKSRSG